MKTDVQVCGGSLGERSNLARREMYRRRQTMAKTNCPVPQREQDSWDSGIAICANLIEDVYENIVATIVYQISNGIQINTL